MFTRILGATASVVVVAALNQSTGASDNSSSNALQSTRLPAFLPDSSGSQDPPWDTDPAHNSDPYSTGPDTGVVRTYDLTIARGIKAPDGYSKPMILVNGEYPGPLIEANWGDTIQVTVNNRITGPEEGTTMHWHGLNHQQSQWEDGVPGTSQCPIAPGQSYTYSFRATPHGTTWYHSHFSAQYEDGMWGPLVIYGPETASYDEDLGTVSITDYFHAGYREILDGILGTDPSKWRPVSDNNLINGKMDASCVNNTKSSSCAEDLAKFSFSSGKKHRLRLINTGIQSIQQFKIDGHKMMVIANDFTQIEPYETDVVTLGVGQRSDVVVEATGDSSGVYYMRSIMSSGACTEPSNQPRALALIYYENANSSSLPAQNESASWPNPVNACENEELAKTIPAYTMSASDPSVTLDMEIGVRTNKTGHLIWTINDSTFRSDYNNPLLLLANEGNLTYADKPELNVYNVGTNKTIRAIVRNQTPTSHPWHLHGHQMQILSSGPGDWDGKVVNSNNPQRRDTQILPANGYIVLQWENDNPGVWPFHCHIGWHLSGGLYANIMEQAEGIEDLKIPQKAFDNCKAWGEYTPKVEVNQTDAGT